MSMNGTMRWRAAVLAVLAAGSLALAGCNKTSPTPGTGTTTQQPGSGY
jgi:predicted small secreted protein